MSGPEVKIVNDTWAVWAAERIKEDNYVGKHRGADAGPWMAHKARHRAPGGEMDSVGFRLVPLEDEVNERLLSA